MTTHNKMPSNRNAGRVCRQRGFLSSRQGLVLLLLIFLAPTFVAWVMHHSGEGGWKPSGATNSGMLIHPARPLQLPVDMQIDDRPLNDYLRGKWTILYAGGVDCGEACNTSLYNMRQVHILQNEKMRRVQRLFVMRGDTLPPELAGLLEKEYPKMAVVRITQGQLERIARFFSVDDVPLLDAGRIYLVDPLGNLMMYYPQGADPRGMHKDLKKLLKNSKIG